MLGPGSDELKLLIDILRRANPHNRTEYMRLIREKVVFEEKGDTRKTSEIERARNMTERLHDKILVQRYICHELDYQGRKFDLRVYYLIASVEVSATFSASLLKILRMSHAFLWIGAAAVGGLRPRRISPSFATRLQRRKVCYDRRTFDKSRAQSND